MYSNYGKVVYLYVETPLHAGAETSLGPVDLPIQREVHTDFPMLQGSGIKGVIRDAFTNIWKLSEQQGKDIFGDTNRASYVNFLDARLLLFPVRSLKGIFAWITCPQVLKRYKRDLEAIGVDFYSPPDSAGKRVSQIPDFTPDDKVYVAQPAIVVGDKIVLEELAIDISADDNIKNKVKTLGDYLWSTIPSLANTVDQNNFLGRLAIVPDEIFRDFTCFSTEIVTRIRLNVETGVVQEGPWTEENLPSETVLYSLMLVKEKIGEITIRKTENNIPQDIKISRPAGLLSEMATFLNRHLQMGGDETVGKGWVKASCENTP